LFDFAPYGLGLATALLLLCSASAVRRVQQAHLCIVERNSSNASS